MTLCGIMEKYEDANPSGNFSQPQLSRGWLLLVGPQDKARTVSVGETEGLYISSNMSAKAVVQ